MISYDKSDIFAAEEGVYTAVVTVHGSAACMSQLPVCLLENGGVDMRASGGSVHGR